MLVHQFPSQHIISSLKNTVSDESGLSLEWPSVVVAARENKYTKHAPESSFTIITNKIGTAGFSFRNKSLRVCEETFFILNPFQTFDYEIQSETEIETLNIHYSYSFFQEALRCLIHSDYFLLDYPEEEIKHVYHFNDQLHYKDPQMNYLLHNYRKEDKENYFFSILQHILDLDKNEKSKINRIKAGKPSTKKELFRRMLSAKDLMFSHYNYSDLSIEFLSKEVAMSKFHFLRVFKSLYKCSPYQYLSRIRFEKAKQLVENSDLPIHEIALKVGFKEANSIFPFIKKHLSVSPLKHRNEELATLNSNTFNRK